MHAAFLSLIRFHARARVRRFRTSLKSPRRLTLTLMALALALVWLGNTLYSVLMREPYAPEVLHRWVSLVVMLYFAWHVVRVSFKRPEFPIEWSPAESHLIAGGPFERSEQVTYRMMVILTATLPKALLTTFVLIPDLAWCSPLGIVLALIFLECCRLLFDIVAFRLDERRYLQLRIMVMSGIVLIGSLAFYTAITTTGVRALNTLGDGARLLRDWLYAADAIRETTIGQLVEWPFRRIADLVTGSGTPGLLITELVAVTGVTIGLFALARRIFGLPPRSTDLQPVKNGKRHPENSAATALPWIPQVGIVSPLIWRQLQCARRHRGSVIVSLLIPAILASLPLFVQGEPTVAFLSVVASIVFYSFVLLPEALKFDFRRDCDFLMKLRMLPARPRDIVFGQLLTPVLIASAFQIAVLLIAGLIKSVPFDIVLGCLAFIIPATTLFVALDNLVFLLYPHRAAQEGFEVFVRTILKFTFKSVMLVAALLVLVVWAPLASAIASAVPIFESTRVVFAVGVCLMVTAAAIASLAAVVRAYARFDVSLDAVG